MTAKRDGLWPINELCYRNREFGIVGLLVARCAVNKRKMTRSIFAALGLFALVSLGPAVDCEYFRPPNAVTPKTAAMKVQNDGILLMV